MMSLALAVTLISQGETVLHEFKYVADRFHKSVSVAGTFNGWNKSATPMSLQSDGRTWKHSQRLTVGKQLYKFVLDDSIWIIDPKVEKVENDGNGNTNGVLFLSPPGFEKKAYVGDNSITKSGLEHRMEIPFLNWDRGQIKVQLKARENDVQSVTLKSGGGAIEMTSVSKDGFYEVFEGKVAWDRKSNLDYFFLVKDGSLTVNLGKGGVGSSNPFRLSSKTFVPFLTPSWVERTVFYQIFPDRFANGDSKNDPRDVVLWGSRPTYANRFGGDIAGVRRHEKHLVDLGVSGVYFNPVFLSPSNHRYDATDFKKIAPDFGTNEEFAEMTRSFEKQGIRTVMDFVFNHTATDFPQFMDIRKNGRESKFKDWFFIKSYPVRVQENPNYEAWFGFPSMPKINVMNPEVKAFYFDVIRNWTSKARLSGMRLDVANEVDTRFWKAMRPFVKSINPEMWIVGEVWGDGSNWLKGDQWDSVMNYQFRDACLKFFAEGSITATQFLNRLMQTHRSYAPQVSRNMMNLLSSHDTPRFLTLCKEDASLAKLAAVVQLTWIGAPSIYYGEEIGMVGGADPDNRRCMDWANVTPNNKILSHYKSLIRARNASRAIQSGDVRILETGNAPQAFSFARFIANDIALVSVNKSEAEQKQLFTLGPSELKALSGRTLIDTLSGTKYLVKGKTLALILPARTAVVLIPVKGNSPSISRSQQAVRRTDPSKARVTASSEYWKLKK